MLEIIPKRGIWFIILIAVVLIFIGKDIYVNSAYPKSYSFQIVAVANKYDLDPCMIASIIKNTSNFDVKYEDKDQIGMMGITEFEADMLDAYLNTSFMDKKQLYDPTYNIAIGGVKLSLIVAQEEDSTSQIVRFFYGPDTLKKWKEESSGYVDSGEDKDKKQFVKKVLRDYEGYKKYRETYFKELKNQIEN